MIDFQYLKEMEARNLKLSDLPEDAQICIQNINDVMKRVRMLEKKGQSVSDVTIKKLKAMDKWTLYEIYDMVNGTDDNEDEQPHDADEVIEELEDTEDLIPAEPEKPKGDPKGLQIDADLKVAYEKGKKEISFEELKTVSRTAYNVIFDGYDESGDNGIETSNYSLLETEENVFTLTKK